MSWWWLGAALTGVLGGAAAFCPKGCTCSSDPAPIVDCEGAGLTGVPILLNPRTRSLNLRGNAIARISHEELEFYQELEFLDLGANGLVRLDKAAFYRLRKLKVLSLRGNRLQSLQIETFRGLENLAILDLSGNSLRRLATSVFVDLRRLELLNISANQIADMSPGALTGLDSLLELQLDGNSLSTLPTVALHAPTNLRLLSLADNRLETLPPHSFARLARLQTLDLAFNQIASVDEAAFSGLDGLLDLDLSSNAFRRVPTLSFRQLPDLQILRMDRNPLRTLTTSSFEGLAGLVELSVEECAELESVDLNAFSGLGSLDVLRLGGNIRLSFIHQLAFEKPNRIRQLRLAGDALQSLPASLLDWEWLESAQLGGNPWRCECELTWIADVLRRAAGGGFGPSGGVCASPPHLAGQSLETAAATGGACGGWALRTETLVTMAMVGGSLFLLTVLGVLLFSLRRRLGLCGAAKEVKSIYATSDLLSASDYDISRDSKKSLLYGYSQPGTLAGRTTVVDSGGYYTSISDPRTLSSTLSSHPGSFKVIRNYPVPITEL